MEETKVVDVEKTIVKPIKVVQEVKEVEKTKVDLTKVEEKQVVPPVSKEEKDNKKVLYIFLGIVAVAVIIVALIVGMFLCGNGSDPKKPTNENQQVIVYQDENDEQNQEAQNPTTKDEQDNESDESEKEDIEDNQAQIASLEKQIETYNQQLATINTQIDEKTTALNDAEAALDALLASDNAENAAANQAANDAFAKRQEVDQAAIDLQTAKTNLEADPENADLQAIVDAQQQVYDLLVQQSQAADALSTELTSAYETKVKEAQDLVEKTNSELELLKEDKAEKEQEIADTQSQLDTLKAG